LIRPNSYTAKEERVNDQFRQARLLSDEEFIQRLIKAGYSREEASAMLNQDLEDAAEEDGYDGP